MFPIHTRGHSMPACPVAHHVNYQQAKESSRPPRPKCSPPHKWPSCKFRPQKVRISPQRNFPPDPFCCLPTHASQPCTDLSAIDQHDLHQAWTIFPWITNHTIWKLEREKGLEYNKHIQIDWKTMLWYVACCRMNFVYTFSCVITVSPIVHYIILINLSLSLGWNLDQHKNRQAVNSRPHPVYWHTTASSLATPAIRPLSTPTAWAAWE